MKISSSVFFFQAEYGIRDGRVTGVQTCALPISMASDGLPTVLALEVALSGRSAEDTRGDPAPDPGDEPGQSAVGCAPHPWRTAEARDRGRTVDGRQVHGEHRLGQLVAQPILGGLHHQYCRI